MNGSKPIIDHYWSLPLIQTKMAPPRAPQGLVRRPALVARITEDVEGSVCVVAAPAGFGKTTLLIECCEVLRNQGHLVAWLSLDHDDEDLQQFGAYLIAAFAGQQEGVGIRSAALMRDDPKTPVKTALSVLLNEIAASDRMVYLVLDDYDRVTSRSIRALVSRLLRYASPNFQVLMGVRSDSALQLGPLQMDGRLKWLGDADLRFALEDAQVFFAQGCGFALDADSVALLTETTEGWVAGLQLAALGLRDAGDASRLARTLATSRIGIDAYLEDAVLSQLPQGLQQFLLRTSILDRLSGGVCDAIMGGGARSWLKLDWLERHNVFIRVLDDERKWFRYHALLSDALRRKAEQQLVDELPALNRRASRWFAAERLWSEAVKHALAAGDMDQAAEWVEQMAMVLVDHSDVGTILGWLARLPDELVEARLRLRLAKAWALGLSMNTSEAQSEIKMLNAALDAGRFDDDPSRNDPMLPAEIATLSAVIAGFADESALGLSLVEQARTADNWAAVSPRVVNFAHTALIFGMSYENRHDEIQRMRSDDRPHDGTARSSLYGDVYVASMYGLAAAVEGRLPLAIDIFEAALASAEASVGLDSTAAALPAGYLSALHYEQNDLARAQQLVCGRSALVLEACPLGSVLRYSITAARLAEHDGDQAVALILLAEARELAVARGWDRLRAACDAQAVCLHLRTGQVALAQKKQEELREIEPQHSSEARGSFLETLASCQTAQARVLLALRRPQQAASVLTELRARIAHAGMGYLICQIDVLLAWAHEEGGARQLALAALHEALVFAQAVGVVRSFVDEGPPVLALLRTARSGLRHSDLLDHDFLDRLIDAFRINAPQRSSSAPLSANPGNGLSGREAEVLQLVARGLSNKEIARALRVAPETVKWHLKNIFDKLDASSRLEAVRAAFGELSSMATEDAV